MKSLSSATQTALAADRVVLAGAAQFSFGTTWRLWSGIGALTLSGVGEFTGIGANALIAPIRSEIGEGVDGVRLTLSRLSSDVAATINDEDYQQKPVIIWRCFFDADDHSLLDFETYFRGRVNTVTLRETAKGESTIEIYVEGAGLDMGRTNGRVRSNSDQRTLGGSTDGGMKHISTAGERTLTWGQKPEQPSLLNGGFNSLGLIRPGLWGFVGRS